MPPHLLKSVCRSCPSAQSLFTSLNPASKVCLPLLQGARGTRLAASAVTIQAAFRGMAVRKELRRVRRAARRIQVTLTQHFSCLCVSGAFFVYLVLLLLSDP